MIPKWQHWLGVGVSAFVVVALFASGLIKVLKLADVPTEFARLGYPEHVILGIGITEITCAAIYAFPRTALLGAILLTGYLGGATATHVRIGDPIYGPVIGGVLVWVGLWLRDARIRMLAPLRSLTDWRFPNFD